MYLNMNNDMLAYVRVWQHRQHKHVYSAYPCVRASLRHFVQPSCIQMCVCMSVPVCVLCSDRR